MEKFERFAKLFTKIYSNNEWGKGSGYGSSRFATRKYQQYLISFMSNNGIRSVVELGCDDFQIMNRVLGENLMFTGYDVVAEVVRHNTIKYGTQSLKFKVVTDYSSVENAQLLICKDVMQHSSVSENKEIINQVLPKYEHVLATNCVGHKKAVKLNEDIEKGSFTNIDLHQQLYNLTGEVVLEWRAP
jgi:hypothetical protein